MKRILLSLVLLLALSPLTPVQAGDGVLYISEDRLEGYDRSLFKHWIDADKNGCDTRKEVLIAEAIVKPKIGKKCVLTGGRWLSSFDGKTHTKDSGLDVDHLVPLAEAWRSGAWAWTDKERENYANFIEQEWMLNAVTASVNRSKSDRDIANWLPTKNVCEYLRGWVIVKAHFNLTVDAAEAKVIDKNYSTCGLGTITKQSQVPISTPSATPSPTPTPTSSVVPMAMLMTPVISIKDSSNSAGGSWVEIYAPGYVAGKADSAPIKGMLTKINKDDRGGQFLGARCRLNSIDGAEWNSGLDIPVTPIVIYCPILNDIEFEFYTYAFLGELKIVSEAVRARVGNPVNLVPTPSPTPSAQTLIVTPGAFCSPAGATGKSSKGVAYTCKTSPTDTKNRWRQ
jgi:hypothetical protein